MTLNCLLFLREAGRECNKTISAKPSQGPEGKVKERSREQNPAHPPAADTHSQPCPQKGKRKQGGHQRQTWGLGDGQPPPSWKEIKFPVAGEGVNERFASSL